MRTNVILLPVIVTAVILCGCAEMRFSEYTDRNRGWPTGSGTMADMGYAVPVYRGWPDKPYRVIGMVRMRDPNAGWNEGDFKLSAKVAKKNGAEAVIIREGAEFGVGMISNAADDPRVLATAQVTVLAIKWRPESELVAETFAKDQLLQEFVKQYPALSDRAEFFNLALDYVVSLSLNPGSAQGKVKLAEVLGGILNQPSDGNTGKWLFRGTVRESEITTSYSQTVVGLATCTQTGTSFTLVSNAGRAQMNFSGTSKGGRLAGQLGFSAGSWIATTKAEGVAQNDRIILTGHAQTADGTFQASFSFLR